MNKLVLIACILMLALPAALATTVSAPNETQALQSVNFSISLDATDQFEYTEIFVSGSKVITVYSNGVTIVDPVNGAFVMNAFSFDHNPESTSGLKLYVSYFGFNEGSHTIEAKAYDNGTQTTSDSKTITAYSPIPSNFVSETNSKLTNLETTTQNISTQVSTATSELTTVKTQVTEIDTEVDTVKTDLETTKSSAKNAESKVTDLESQVTKLNTNVTQVKASNEEVKKEVDEFKSETSEKLAAKLDNPLAAGTGLVGLGNEANPVSPLIPLAVFIVIVIAVVAVIARKKFFTGNDSSIYTGEEKEEEETDSLLVPDYRNVPDEEGEEEDSSAGGKWAFKGKSFKKVKMPEEKEEKFNLRDLIKSRED